ncbi:MAG: outer membrane protein assembly factor BamE [Gammaproteobacteria bacterium]|nr:outer membrane protein assembly factor BamE [Gammaproteobacteria bacterium]MDE2346640.1 outer membrane protein assembly factor BamE [Gammaproteobacteria bacterium]
MRLVQLAMMITAISLAACVYRPDIRQGNFLKPDMIAQIKPGMTEAQVRLIMGPPMITDPFHPDRWDYVYYDRPSSLDENTNISRQHVVIVFKDGKVTSIEQPMPPKNARG